MMSSNGHTQCKDCKWDWIIINEVADSNEDTIHLCDSRERSNQFFGLICLMRQRQVNDSSMRTIQREGSLPNFGRKLWRIGVNSVEKPQKADEKPERKPQA